MRQAPTGPHALQEISLLDAPIDKQMRDDLEKLLKENHDAFAEDERQIGITPLIKISIDTGDHLPIPKKPYAIALKHYNWVKEEIDKLLEAGIIRESHSSGSVLNCGCTQNVVVAKGYAWISEP